MEIGRCPRCATPYTASEIAGFGILRARAARAGGPRMEYRCQHCDRMLHLIPHGDGRYAPPGAPPPPAVPASERRPPWITDEPPPGRSAGTEDVGPPPGAGAPPPFEIPTAEPDAPPTDAAEDDDGPLDVVQAMALLGVPASADEGAIQRAFRERSLTCHPDKVAHLDPEFQALAERKFKRLRQAYELLIS